MGSSQSRSNLKQLDDDRNVCQLRLAVNDRKDQPMSIDVATFGVQADACSECLSKGRAVALTGRLVYRMTATAPRYSRLHIVGSLQIRGRRQRRATARTTTTQR
jgi:single-stranded DNA-binding protein